ncbi:MAG: histidine kinase [Bacteroidaceae bacterium]|nr:histidine kinase [Bacteroidaceae bacterium]
MGRNIHFPIKGIRGSSRQENLIYLAVWGLLFAAPLLSLYIRTAGDRSLTFDWAEVFVVWRTFAVFLLLFLVHNFLLAPLLVHGNKRMTYFSIVAIILAAFTVYQCNSRPPVPWKPMGHKPRIEQLGKHKPPRAPRRNAPPPIIGEHDILAVLFLILMFGANVGIKGYIRSREDQKRMNELEHENLEQQLDYLRQQISPHFFMNTLNNIHALVDIDPVKAKETIVELSRMMRYVLYESNRQYVNLQSEFEFIRHYVALMQLRYTDKVSITLGLPQDIPDRQIPPLLLITFIENAFKHGISYQHESFIEIKISIEDDKLTFTCRNSKADLSNDEEGGVGLTNVRKRLNLLYDRHYTLRIEDAPYTYSVNLVISLAGKALNDK